MYVCVKSNLLATYDDDEVPNYMLFNIFLNYGPLFFLNLSAEILNVTEVMPDCVQNSVIYLLDRL